MGRGGLDPLAREPVLGPIRGQEEVVGRVEVASRHDHVEAGVSGGELSRGCGDGAAARYISPGQLGKFVEVRSSPADQRKKLVLQADESGSVKQRAARTGSDHGVENKALAGNGGAGKEAGYDLDNAFGGQHADFYACNSYVIGKAIQGFGEQLGVEGVDAANSPSGLNGEGRDG